MHRSRGRADARQRASRNPQGAKPTAGRTSAGGNPAGASDRARSANLIRQIKAQGRDFRSRARLFISGAKRRGAPASTPKISDLRSRSDIRGKGLDAPPPLYHAGVTRPSRAYAPGRYSPGANPANRRALPSRRSGGGRERPARSEAEPISFAQQKRTPAFLPGGEDGRRGEPFYLIIATLFTHSHE